jgi:U3 small nucleolar RNA-associated protein 3
MAKKRKSRGTDKPSKTTNDTFDDSADEFVQAKDQILFDEGPAAKRRRRLEEDEAELMPSDEEVFADQYDDEDDSDGSAPVDENESDADARLQDEEEDDERYWGDNKADYYNADAIETEQDALDEEVEARRLQKKQLQDMTDADFEFEEMLRKEDEDLEREWTALEKLPPIEIPEDADDEDKLAILDERYPELKNYKDALIYNYKEFKKLQTEVAREKKGSHSSPTVKETQLRATAAHGACLAMYMALLTSSKTGMATPLAELRQHPVAEYLLATQGNLQDTWHLKADDMLEGTAMEDNGKRAEEAQAQAKATDIAETLPKTVKSAKSMATDAELKKSKKKTVILEPAPLGLSDDEVLAEPKVPKSKPKKTKQKHTTISDLLAQSAPTAAQLAKSSTADDFGDEAPLTAEEAAEKARKKKSLRFYTSQIAQKSGKRAAASRQAGGDDDLPHRERIRDRQERLLREAEARNAAAGADPDGLRNNNKTADDDDYDANDLSTATRLNNDPTNDYYATLVSASSAKKADKAARAAAQREADAAGAQLHAEEVVGPDGKRRITYAIAKNKGLAPKRKKEVRNPRVKKKLKFEEKKKKLASMKPVWKGGEGKGGYKGEMTGIKSNLVKSVKL